MNDDFDEVLATSMIKIRSGILSQDWIQVIEGYNTFSGENLPIPEQKSRLEKIRERIVATNEHLPKVAKKKQTKAPKATETIGDIPVVIQDVSPKQKIISAAEDPKEKAKNEARRMPQTQRPPRESVFDKFKDSEIVNLDASNFQRKR